MSENLEDMVEGLVANVIREMVDDYLDSYLSACLIKLSAQEECSKDFKQHVEEYIHFNRNGYQEWDKWDREYANLMNFVLEMTTLKEVKK